ncbi:hypothetical protein [Nocardia sp. NPDC059239]|uniref:hypothetical protein n=1 Tax=Nocardia sp. NPDC059239 TaxID=3346785 RepID=UPI0036761F23
MALAAVRDPRELRAPATEDEIVAFVRFSLGPNGFSIDRIRADRILHEALTGGPDPLRPSMVFSISHETALRYATIADRLLVDEL